MFHSVCFLARLNWKDVNNLCIGHQISWGNTAPRMKRKNAPNKAPGAVKLHRSGGRVAQYPIEFSHSATQVANPARGHVDPFCLLSPREKNAEKPGQCSSKDTTTGNPFKDDPWSIYLYIVPLAPIVPLPSIEGWRKCIQKPQVGKAWRYSDISWREGWKGCTPSGPRRGAMMAMLLKDHTNTECKRN